MMPNSVLISVVIPTFGRPDFLADAIASAIESIAPETGEIIVVPNGPDESWKAIQASYQDREDIIWNPINEAHANLARNAGLQRATGRYIRFLDDDDILHKGSSKIQCELLEKSGSDICTGMLDLTTFDGRIYATRSVPCTADFIEAILRPDRITQPTAHVFRTDRIKFHQWGKNDPIIQDILWLYRICEADEWKWSRLEQPVGAWRQHQNSRTSRTKPKAVRAKTQAYALLEVAETLETQGRLTTPRAQAIANSLWRLVCGNYFSDGGEWQKLLGRLQHQFPNTFPDLFLYKTSAGRLIRPTQLLKLTAPMQRVKFEARKLLIKLRIASPEKTF